MIGESEDAEAAFGDIQSLWAKYEDIAMHFNDLLMRLRTQSLAGIAAMSTLVGLFTKEGMATPQMSWLAAMAIFVAMSLFWIAIWCLDFLYYNRLLVGAVSEITRIEEKTRGAINMSTSIEAQFGRSKSDPRRRSFRGVLAFYGIVLLVIVCGGVFSYAMYYKSEAQPKSAPHASAYR